MIRLLLLAALAAGLSGAAVAQNSDSARTWGPAGSSSSMEAAGWADCAAAKNEQRQRGNGRQDAAMPGNDDSNCSEAEYALYKQALDPARMMANEPSAAGYLRASPSRVQVITELKRAREAGELDWASFELGLGSMSRRR